MVFHEEKIYSKSAADMIILNPEGKIMLTKRNVEPYKGFWVFPGGHIKKETAIAAVKREVYEETGLKVEVDKLYGIYSNLDHDPRFPTVSILYIGHVTGGMFEPTIEVSEANFFSKEEMPKEIGFNHQEIIDDYFKYPEGQPL